MMIGMKTSFRNLEMVYRERCSPNKAQTVSLQCMKKYVFLQIQSHPYPHKNVIKNLCPNSHLFGEEHDMVDSDNQ